MKRRYKAKIAAPLIVLAYLCLTLYERFVEGQHYVETIK